LIDSLDRLFLWTRSKPFFLRLTLFTRILLAAGFIPTGMVKLLGRRFTTMPVDTQIGEFFEVMYQTGLYWQFIGFSQVLAGLLLLIPRWAHLGAYLFVPIMANIFVITVSLGFRGTPAVTGLMLLAVLYLSAWDYPRVRGAFTDRPWNPGITVPVLRLDWLEKVGFAVFAASLLAVFLTTRRMVSTAWVPTFMILGLAAGLVTLVRFLWVGRRLA
jgi:uncharacterized membrane protein YphA (DoxX/SURF4 family)